MIKSWKTTAAGVVAIVGGLVFAFNQYLGGGLPAVSWEVLLTAIVSGIGLIVAKDAGVSNAPAPGPAVKVVGPGA